MIEIKAILDEDFVNYRKCSMFIGFPKCSFKCGEGLCQNSALATAESKQISAEDLVNRYLSNPLSEAIVIGGLEPFDTYEQLKELVTAFRKKTFDDIVIYTGYEPEEIIEEIQGIWHFPNMYFKFGRYIPEKPSRFDEILGVTLASDNQYGYCSEVGATITINPDKEHVKKIRAALQKKNGHCPCSLIQSEDTLCPCKEFREQEEDGFCHCQLYKKEYLQ